MWQQEADLEENSSRVNMKSRVKKITKILTSRHNEQSPADLENSEIDVNDLDANEKRTPGPGDTMSSNFMINKGRFTPDTKGCE